MTVLCVFSLLGISGCKFMEKVNSASLHKHSPGNYVQGHHHRHMQRHDY